jgi:hypothetical protein
MGIEIVGLVPAFQSEKTGSTPVGSASGFKDLPEAFSKAGRASPCSSPIIQWSLYRKPSLLSDYRIGTLGSVAALRGTKGDHRAASFGDLRAGPGAARAQDRSRVRASFAT